jgi:hypothetical protein
LAVRFLFSLLGHANAEVKKMYRDSDGERTNAAIIPIANMLSGGGVIFFGEDPGIIGDMDEDDNDIRDLNI